MRTLLVAFAFFLVPGLMTACMRFSNNVQPVNNAIEPKLIGKDCSWIVLGIGFGENTVERAQQNNLRRFGRDVGANSPITKIRVISLDEEYIFIAGKRCVVVVGEP